MASQTEKLTLELRAKSYMDGPLRKARNAIKSFTSKAKLMLGKVKAAFMAIKGLVVGLPGILLGLATALGGRLAWGLSQAAANAEELDSKFKAIFKESAPEMQVRVDALAESVARGREQIKGYVADSAQWSTALGYTGEAAENLALDITQLGIDLASFSNLEDETEAIRLLRNGLLAGGEALERFGIKIVEEDLKSFAETLGLNSKELDTTEKAMVRMLMVVDRMPDAMNDAENTSGSFQNRMRSIQGVIHDARVEFGRFINEGIVRAIDEIGGVKKLEEVFRSFFGAVAAGTTVVIKAGTALVQFMLDQIEAAGGAEAFIAQLFGRVEQAVWGLKAAMLGIMHTLDKVSEAAGWVLFDTGIEKVEELEEKIESEKRQRVEIRDIIRAYRDEGVEAAQAIAGEHGHLAKLIRQSGGDFEWFSEIMKQESKESVEESRRLKARLEEVTSELTGIDRALYEARQRASGGGTQPTLWESIFGVAGSEELQAAMELEERLAATKQRTDELTEAIMGYIQARQEQQPIDKATLTAMEQLAEAAQVTADRWSEMGASATQAFAGGLTDALFAMADGSMSAKEAFSEFAVSFVAQTARMVVQALILQAIMASLGMLPGPSAPAPGSAGFIGPMPAGPGFANGGILEGHGTFLPVKGYATGGPIMRAPHIALVGEGRYNEAVVPLPDGKSIPVSMQGGGQANVSINIKALDGKDVQATLAENSGAITDMIAGALMSDRGFRQQVRSV